MKKDLEINTLTSEINGLLANYNCQVSDQMLKQTEYLSHSLKLLAPVYYQSYHLFDLNKSTFISINSVHEERLFKPAIYANQPPNSAEFLDLVHPDDQIFLLTLQREAIQYLLKLPPERAKEFRLGFTIRLMIQKDKYEYFSIRFNAVLCDEQGKPWLLLIDCNYCPLVQLNKADLYRMISIEPSDLCRKNKLFNNKEFVYLTKCEKLIVTAVNNGYQKKEIAEILNKSLDTIKKHCSHIRGKSGFSSIHQASLHTIRMGIMPLWITFYMFIIDILLPLELLTLLSVNEWF